MISADGLDVFGIGQAANAVFAKNAVRLTAVKYAAQLIDNAMKGPGKFEAHFIAASDWHVVAALYDFDQFVLGRDRLTMCVGKLDYVSHFLRLSLESDKRIFTNCENVVNTKIHRM